MRIVDGKKYLKKEIDGCVEIDGKGWDSYDGRNMQWYRLKYNPECDLVILDADNSGNGTLPPPKHLNTGARIPKGIGPSCSATWTKRTRRRCSL